MRRYLTWHIDHIRGDNDAQGPVYYADRDYTPGAVRLYARQAPNGDDLQVDIRADNVSLFTSVKANLNQGGNLEEHAEDYPQRESQIAEGSVISFHILKTAGAAGITCTLEVTSLSDEDEEGE